MKWPWSRPKPTPPRIYAVPSYEADIREAERRRQHEAYWAQLRRQEAAQKAAEVEALLGQRLEDVSR